MSDLVLGYDCCDEEITCKHFIIDEQGINITDQTMTVIECGARIVDQLLSRTMFRGSTSLGIFTMISGLRWIFKNDADKAVESNIK